MSYTIREHDDGTYTVTSAEEEIENENENTKICCFGCIGLIILSIVSYILILVSGYDVSGGPMSYMAAPFGFLWAWVVTSVPFLSWVPVANLCL